MIGYKHSAFYYGHIVKSETSKIPFREVGDTVDRVATMSLGSYTLSEYCIEIARVMTEAGEQQYNATIDRETRLITISAEDPFRINFGSSEFSGSSIRILAGFPEMDTALLNEHEGTFPSGLAYFPSTPLDKYTPFEHWKDAGEASVSTSASGRSQVVSFGEVYRMRCNITGITNALMDERSIIKNNPNAKEEAISFLSYITKKNPVEFMFDRRSPSVFTKCVLESTKDSKSGIGFELYEGLGKGLRGVYQTDTLIFRRID